MIRLVSPRAMKNSATVAGQVHLLEMLTVDVRAKCTIAPSEAPDPPWQLDFKDSVGNVRRVDDVFEVPVTFTATGRQTDTEAEFVRISVKYLVRYAIHEGAQISESQLKDFAELNALYNAWPYARASIQELSVRVGYPPMVMPLLLIQPRESKRSRTKRQPAKDA